MSGLIRFCIAVLLLGSAHAWAGSTPQSLTFSDPHPDEISAFNAKLDAAMESFAYRSVPMTGSAKSGFALDWLNRVYLQKGDSARGRVFVKSSLKMSSGFEFGKIYEIETGTFAAAFHTSAQADYLIYFSGIRRSLVQDMVRAMGKTLDAHTARFHFWRVSPFATASAEGKNYYCSGETPTNSMFSAALGILKSGGSCIHDIGVGVWQSTGGFVHSMGHDLANLGETWKKLKAEISAFGNFIANFQESFGEFKDQIVGLPLETQAKILCELAGNVGAGIVISALTSGAGGATFAAGLASAVSKISKLKALAGTKSLAALGEKLERRAARLKETPTAGYKPSIGHEIVAVKTLGVAACNDFATLRGTRGGLGQDLERPKPPTQVPQGSK